MRDSRRNAPTIFELNVPSGAMVVGNDFRGHFRILGGFNVNEPKGKRKITKAMASVGCAYGFVGNSFPGVYQTKPNTFIIAGSGEEGPPPGAEVASICTDLRWYSVVDHDEFKRRGCERKYRDAQLVLTKPGVYRFTHYNTRFAGYKKPHIYAKIEWVRKPDPVKDYASEWAKQNFTAGQVIARNIAMYPTLFGGPDGVRQAAEHIFCVTGGGGDWHENGFVLYDPETSSRQEEVSIPLFDEAYNWCPMRQHSNLCRAAGIGDFEIMLNPSFLALAYNVANCIIKHGSTGNSENVKIAKRCVKGLNKKYGHTG